MENIVQEFWKHIPKTQWSNKETGIWARQGSWHELPSMSYKYCRIPLCQIWWLV
jgi:hypothetical protein